MQAQETTSELQLLNGIVTLLGKGDAALSDSFTRHAAAALVTVQQAVRACGTQQQGSKLSEAFQKVLEHVLKRTNRCQVGAVVSVGRLPVVLLLLLLLPPATAATTAMGLTHSSPPVSTQTSTITSYLCGSVMRWTHERV